METNYQKLKEKIYPKFLIRGTFSCVAILQLQAYIWLLNPRISHKGALVQESFEFVILIVVSMKWEPVNWYDSMKAISPTRCTQCGPPKMLSIRNVFSCSEVDGATQFVNKFNSPSNDY